MRCICSAVLAHLVLKERLNIFGILGCILCIVGSITIVLHAPEEQPITSLLQVWRLALQPGKKVLPSMWFLGCVQYTSLILVCCSNTNSTQLECFGGSLRPWQVCMPLSKS